MHRFYISPENWHPDAFALTGSDAHHSRDVLRMKRGEKLVLFNGCGREITAEIIDLGSSEIRLRKLHEAETPPLRCRIVLGQAVPKGKNMELIVQKAVEIGADQIAPIFEAVDAGGSPAESLESQPTRLPLQKDIPRFDLRLIGSLQPDAQHLKKILADYSGEHQHRPQSVLMLVGPEGDFTPAELALARRHGCRPITLGPIILRVETAAIYCLSVLSYELLT
jgi:16S rRNA (uracil1498-N3)-methyltransferase